MTGSVSAGSPVDAASFFLCISDCEVEVGLFYVYVARSVWYLIFLNHGEGVEGL